MRRAAPAGRVRFPSASAQDRILDNFVMSKTVPLSRARAGLSELVDAVQCRHEHVVITHNGHPAAVLVPSDEFDAVEEPVPGRCRRPS